MENERIYSVQEALDVLKERGIVNSQEVLRRWLRQGKLEGIAPVSRKGGWKVTQSALDAFVAARSIDDTDIVALKKELHQLRNNATSTVANEIDELKAQHERDIANLKAEHVKVLAELEKAHNTKIEALQTQLFDERERSIEQMKEISYRIDERNQIHEELSALKELSIKESQAIIDDIAEAEWIKYYAMGFVNDMVLIRKTHVKDALAHRQLSGSYAKELFETIWHKLEMNNYGRGKDIRIAVLDEHFKFDGQRIKLSDDFTTMSERVVYPILEYVQQNRIKKR